MVEFRNKITGGTMWVAEDRVDEYKAAGHVPAVEPVEAVKPTEEKPVEAKKPGRRTKRG